MRRDQFNKLTYKLGVLKTNFRLEFLVVILILLIGISFRIYKFKTIPFGLNHDAALIGLVAIDLWQKLPHYTPYYHGWVGETFYHYWLALNFFLFGISDTTLRMASMLIGISTLPLYYLLAKSLQGKITAYFSLFFLVISGWHMTMSKVGWIAILVPLIQSLTILFLYKSLRENKKIFWLFSGISLALTLNTYGAARITPLIIAVILIFWFFKERPKIKNYILNCTVLIVSFSIVILPLLLFALRDWDTFTSRARFLAVTNRIQTTNSLGPLVDNFKISLGLLHTRANGDDFFVNEPLLEKVPGLLFFIGLISLLLKMQKLESSIILVWFILGFLPGLTSIPNGNHNFSILPPLYLLVGQGAATILFIFEKFFNKKLIAYILILQILIFASYETYQQYLSKSRREIWGFYPETTVVSYFMNEYKDSYKFYLTDNYPRDAITFITYGGGNPFEKHYIWFENKEEFLEVEQDSQKGLMFFMMDLPQNIEIKNKLLAKFPNAYSQNLIYKDDNINRIASSVVIVPTNNPK